MHSGKTVEINNTDAEGRLLLADALSYVARTYKPDALLNMATLTGAQLVATGTRHAAVVSNREGLERLALSVGRASGDLTWPLPFAPEFFQDEFKSKVADMKNSVANRMQRPVVLRRAVRLQPHPGHRHPLAAHRPGGPGVPRRARHGLRSAPDRGPAARAHAPGPPRVAHRGRGGLRTPQRACSGPRGGG